MALLAREREGILEWVSSANRRTRRRVRLQAGTAPGEPLMLQLQDADWGEPPAAGMRVMLVLPVQNSLWRFTSAAQMGAAPGGAFAIAWPTEVTQEPGRRHERANQMLPVAVMSGGLSGGGRPICTYTLDVSMGGIQIALPAQYPIGARLRLSMKLPYQTVTADAAVAWSRPSRDVPGDPMYSTGLRFEALAPRDASRLRILLGMSGVG